MTRRKPGDWWTESVNDVTGCSPFGVGCVNCSARDMVRRLPHLHGIMTSSPGPDYPYPWHTVRLHPERREEALRWRKPRIIARSLLGDVFHEAVTDIYNNLALYDVLGTPQHQWVWLTKRFDRAVQWAGHLGQHPPTNLLLMFSASVQSEVDAACRAAAKLPEGWRYGIHIEPMLESVDLISATCNAGADSPTWIVCGCENGPRRPMEHAWAHDIIEQCQDGGVPVWLKGWYEPPAWIAPVPRETPW